MCVIGYWVLCLCQFNNEKSIFSFFLEHFISQTIQKPGQVIIKLKIAALAITDLVMA